MNISISEIESSLNIKLPDFYKKTILDYPFNKDSFGQEMLLNSLKDIISINKDDWSHVDFGNLKPFFVGSDGGEETYFIDLKNDKTPVYVYDIESNSYSIHSESWQKFIQNINKIDLEIEEDENKLKNVSALTGIKRILLRLSPIFILIGLIFLSIFIFGKLIRLFF